METDLFNLEDTEFITACKTLTSPVLTLKKTFTCNRCGLTLSTKHRLDCHMASRNCKRLRIDEDDELQPHQNIGSNLQVCIDTYKTAKEKNHNDERVM